METKTIVANLDPKQDMKELSLYSVPRRSVIRLASDWIRGGQLPHWPQFISGEAIPTYQGRDAIALSCHYLNLNASDEVLVPSYNCGTEIDPILKQGISVCLYRVDARAKIDIENILERITHRTRAILVTHYFGWAQDLKDVVDICKEKGLYLIEDCAHALFSAGDRGLLGQDGDVAIYSLPKTIAIPNGGVLVVNNEIAVDVVKMQQVSAIQSTRDCLKLIKRNAARNFGNTRIGRAALSKWRSKQQCANGNGQVEIEHPDMPLEYYFHKKGMATGASRVAKGSLIHESPDQIVKKRRRNYEHLTESIKHIGSMKLLYDSLDEGTCPLHLPVVVNQRKKWFNVLTSKGVYALPWWEGYHRKLDWTGFDEAVALKDNVLTLPIHQDLTESDIDLIAESVHQADRIINKT